MLVIKTEEPNANLFIRAPLDKKSPVTQVMPEWIEGKCTGCGRCSDFCQFKAIINMDI